MNKKQEILPAATGFVAGTLKVSGVASAVIRLDGIWKFNMKAPEEFWKNEFVPDAWGDMPVPGDIWAQGVEFWYDQPVAYKKRIDIPADFVGQRVILHFDAVHNLATVWVNGQEVTTHQGGWTPWECDITDHVTPGQAAWVTLRVTDLSREISFNGKAQRPIGGITRSVELRARPATFFQLPIVSTPFDGGFENATLQVVGRVTRPAPGAQASFRLFDSSGKEIKLDPHTVPLDQEIVTFKTPVARPVLWDAEHPNLYRLEITVKGKGQSDATYSRRIGFRDIRFDGKHNLLINGKVVKFRGANRHLSNPTGGKVPTAEYERLDTELAKEANMNFFRTSHYPPGVGLLEQCDEIGMYVTVESAIEGGGQPGRPSEGMHDDPAATRYFLSQLEEMVLNYGSHPSVIIWSTANESRYGLNFLESYKLCKRVDPSRPVIASYQQIEDAKHESYDIYSYHYPTWNCDFTKVTMPTFYDEWIHVLGHGAPEWFHDPNGRDYWGRSLDMAWTSLFPADGSLGGAIWNYIDDVTYLPDPGLNLKTHDRPRRFLAPGSVRCHTPVPRGNVFGVARWGVIDEWRRKKPEFWNTKKAYSPVRVLVREVTDFQPGQPLSLPVHNRFDHSDLAEITMRVTYDGSQRALKCDALAPHAQGKLTIPAAGWREGTELRIEFMDQAGRIVDIENIAIGKPVTPQPVRATPGAKIEKADDRMLLVCGKAVFTLNAGTGLFESFADKAASHTFAGPHLHLYLTDEYFEKIPENNQERGRTVTYDGPDVATWKLLKLETESQSGVVRLRVEGSYGDIGVMYTYTIGGNGRLDVDYAFTNIPPLVASNKLREESGQITLEAGIKFKMDDSFDRLTWHRKGYWTYYPDGHQGALKGSVPLFTEVKPPWRQHPGQPWESDVHDWFYQGVDVPAGKLMPNIAKSAKMGIYDYTLSAGPSDGALTVYGNGEGLSARFMRVANGDYELHLLDTLDYRLRWGNYSAKHPITSARSGTVRLEAKP